MRPRANVLLSIIVFVILALAVSISTVLSADPPSTATITLEDLPPGFVVPPPDDESEQIDNGVGFSFADYDNGTMLFGGVDKLLPEEEGFFDVVLSHPETYLDLFLEQSDLADEYINPEILNYVTIGDASVAISVQMEATDLAEISPESGDLEQLDHMIFRHGDMLATLLLSYPASNPPDFTLEEIALLWNGRMDGESQPIAPDTVMSPPLRDPLYELLTLQDMPDGYVAVSDADLEQIMQVMAGSDEDLQMPVAGAFAFADDYEFEFVIGATFDLSDPLNRLVFGMMTNDPETVVEVLRQYAMEFGFLLPIESLPPISVGDSSTAMSAVIPIDDSLGPPIEMRAETVFFQRDKVGAYLMVFYPDEEEPSVSLSRLAVRWDRRIADAIESQTLPVPGSTPPTPTPTFTPTPTPSSVRPATGRLRNKFASNGEGRLRVENGSDHDGLVIVTDTANNVLFVAYVRAKGIYTMSAIPDGLYRVFFATGDEWDDEAKTFTRNIKRSKFDEPIRYTTDSNTSTKWNITLHPVIDGNAKTSTVSEDEFPVFE